MILKYKNIEGELKFAPSGYYALDRDGSIYSPELIFIGQDNNNALYCYGAIIALNDDKGNVVILDEAELRQTMTLSDLIKYLKYEIKMNRLDTLDLIDTAENIINRLGINGVRVFDNVKEYVRNREFLNLLKQNSNE